jgi:hypothetical protein
MALTQIWATRTFYGKTYHAIRPEADPVTALCGLAIPDDFAKRLWEREVPKYCRKCPRCVSKGS